MLVPVVEFHPEAIAEARAAREWYHQRSPKAARAFLSELDQAVRAIRSAPELWPKYRQGTRRYLLRRFPFSVVYRLGEAVIQVVAVAHARRRPGYWQARQSTGGGA